MHIADVPLKPMVCAELKRQPEQSQTPRQTSLLTSRLEPRACMPSIAASKQEVPACRQPAVIAAFCARGLTTLSTAGKLLNDRRMATCMTCAKGA